MGRRSSPQGRLSLRKATRLQRLEAVVVTLSVLLLAAGVLTIITETRTTNRLHHGTDVTATIVSAGSYHSLRLGRFARLSYTAQNEPFTRTVHYDGPLLRQGRVIAIRVDPGNPESLVIRSADITGRSVDLWLRAVIGSIVAAVGVAGLLIFMSNHQWRFTEDD